MSKEADGLEEQTSENNQETGDRPTSASKTTDRPISAPLTVDRPISAITEESTLDSELTDVIVNSVKKPIQFYTEDYKDKDIHIQVTAIPSGGAAPIPTVNRVGPVQELSKSCEWHFTPEDDHSELKKIVKPENYHFEYNPLDTNMSNNVSGRTAGRMPGKTSSASTQVLRMARRQNEYFKKAPPLRTPPSIPSPFHVRHHKKDASPRFGQTFNAELEHHARSVRSPRRFMEHG